jgi:hypothetical protein
MSDQAGKTGSTLWLSGRAAATVVLAPLGGRFTGIAGVVAPGLPAASRWCAPWPRGPGSFGTTTRLFARLPRIGPVTRRLRSLLETFAGVAVFAAGPPVTAPLFDPRLRCALRGLRLDRRFPQPSAREPLHDDVRVLPLQLVKRREQLFALARAKSRRLLIDEDGPVRVARGHSPSFSPKRTLSQFSVRCSSSSSVPRPWFLVRPSSLVPGALAGVDQEPRTKHGPKDQVRTRNQEQRTKDRRTGSSRTTPCEKRCKGSNRRTLRFIEAEP